MTFKDYCAHRIPLSKQRYLSNRFDVIGNIAIITIHPELEHHKHIIAEAILTERRNITTVLNKAGMVKEDARIAPFEVLAGGDTITCHNEFRYHYWMNVAEVFFNPRLAYERKRITDQVVPGETVFIPFCGVGPFAIPPAARHCSVIAMDSNEKACRWLQKNARENNVEDSISIIRGDATRLPITDTLHADRAIIPTPYGMDTVLESIIPVVKPGGRIHFYTFKKAFEIETLLNTFSGMSLKVVRYRRCGHVAPAVSRFVFYIKKNR
jgi:tRNA (guanine37-N1)-methyltransferase